MPIVLIHQSAGRTTEEKRAALKGVTDAISGAYQIEADLVTVIFSDMSPDSWGKGGDLRMDSD